MYSRIFQEGCVESALTRKIQSSLDGINVPIMELASQKSTSRKFSVLSNDSCQFVNLFQKDTKATWYAVCQSRLCDLRFKKKRKVENLEECQFLCPHLTTFKMTYKDLFGEISVMDDNTDMQIEMGNSNTIGDGLPSKKVIFIDQIAYLWKFYLHTVNKIPFIWLVSKISNNCSNYLNANMLRPQNF